MKKRSRRKKGLAIILTAEMVTGLVPVMSGGANEVQAATGSGTGNTPSVSAYATKEQMMDGTFAPNSSGEAENYGKLVFGRNSYGEPQEWYILGKDDGVSGGNTIIFAASLIPTDQMFEDDSSSNKTFVSSFGEYETAPSEVYPNHYGASDLRAILQSMATNTSYFTQDEQDLMNATTVTTKDTKNSATYTTTDKLYALAAVGVGGTIIKAGTSDSTVFAMKSYWGNIWGSGYLFWLRSPSDDSRSDALFIDDAYVEYINVCNGLGVQPASNLNLSSVLFASAATAAPFDTAESGTIADGTAMTLRLDGTGKNIGTVKYNTTTGDIKAAKGSTEGDVALVVQGNDGTSDWYYSEKITGTETVKVNASEIKSNLTLLGISSDIDLSDCKIWLETTDSTENLSYAVGATEILSITTQPPKKGDVVEDDKASAKIEVADVTKKEVTYKEPANKKAKTVAIPATVKIDGVTYKVTKIVDNAFKGNKTVTKVTIGSNIKTIGKNAFYGATKLSTVSIGKSVTEIGANAFKGCTSLTSVAIPSKTTKIGTNAFYGCKKLKKVSIGKSVTEIGANAFKGCSALTSVTIPSKTTKIGANAFYGCKKLKTITIKSTKLTSKTVAKNAFKGLTRVTTIKVPKKKLTAYKKLFKSKGLSSKVTVKGY